MHFYALCLFALRPTEEFNSYIRRRGMSLLVNIKIRSALFDRNRESKEMSLSLL